MKFRCESKEDILLPPKYTFPQAFNYLSAEHNSFYILENGNDFIQCAGSKSTCSIEVKKDSGHYVFYDPTGSEEEVTIDCSVGPIHRKSKHCFHFSKAIELFKCFYTESEFPEELKLEKINYKKKYDPKAD